MSKNFVVVKKIKELKRIHPDSSWLVSQKSFLLSEISRTQNEKRKPSLVGHIFDFNIFKILRPNFAIALIVIVLISSLTTVGVISAAQNSLSGDFLYPVKTVLEKTQLTFSPTQESKTKLSIKFATQRMDEFTQLINKPEKKKDTEKTVKKFTTQLVNVQEGIDKLKEKNTEKAAEVAKLVKAQTPAYEETLIEASEQLAYILPEDKEDLKKNIDEALVEVNKIEKANEELIKDSEQGAVNNEQPDTKEEILVPIEEEEIESPSVPFEEQFENLQPETEE